VASAAMLHVGSSILTRSGASATIRQDILEFVKGIIGQLINTFVAPVSREVPIAPSGGPRVGGTSAPVSGGPT